MLTVATCNSLFIVGLLALTTPRLCLGNDGKESKKPEKHAEHAEHEEEVELVATSPKSTDVTITQPYVCQIHARRHIEIRALVEGYLEEVKVKEGQMVQQGEVIFQLYPPLYEAKLAAAQAEAMRAQVEYDNTMNLFGKGVVSEQEVKLKKAELAKAEAEVKLAQAELGFASIKAPFPGLIDRQYQQQGSLVKEEDLLTSLSDTSVMWVYFNVPEARYFEFLAIQGKTTDRSRIELKNSTIELRLADGNTFNHNPGNSVTVEGQFNNETGNIPFRADFPNPDGVLRHGQTGTILVHRNLQKAIVIPQRATFEILDKQFVWRIDEHDVVHQQPIAIAHELEDVFVLKEGLSLEDKFILDGVRHVHEGQKVKYDFHKPDEVLTHQKFHAE